MNFILDLIYYSAIGILYQIGNNKIFLILFSLLIMINKINLIGYYYKKIIYSLYEKILHSEEIMFLLFFMIQIFIIIEGIFRFFQRYNKYRFIIKDLDNRSILDLFTIVIK